MAKDPSSDPLNSKPGARSAPSSLRAISSAAGSAPTRASLTSARSTSSRPIYLRSSVVYRGPTENSSPPKENRSKSRSTVRK